jgi:hypothetical protein
MLIVPEHFEKTEDCIFIAILFTASQNKDCILETAWKNLVEYNKPKSNISPLVSKPKILLLQVKKYYIYNQSIIFFKPIQKLLLCLLGVH